MSNEQAPECCPFCGAEVSVHNGHKRSNGEYAVYRCGTWIDVTLKNKIGSRAVDCWAAERERLARERDEAVQKMTEMAFKAGELTARVKRLEDAGDAIVDRNIGCGCGQDGPCRACRMACEAWTKAKEATP